MKVNRESMRSPSLFWSGDSIGSGVVCGTPQRARWLLVAQSYQLKSVVTGVRGSVGVRHRGGVVSAHDRYGDVMFLEGGRKT